MTEGVCSRPGCDRPLRNKAYRLCFTHNERRLRGKPMDEPIASPLNRPTHGLSQHWLASTWYGMVNRCTRPGNDSFIRYGARGITVYRPWLDRLTGLPAFIEYVEGELGDRPDGFTLDRIDNGRGYEPGNLRWAPDEVQRANKRQAYIVDLRCAKQLRSGKSCTRRHGHPGQCAHGRLPNGIREWLAAREGVSRQNNCYSPL